MVTPSNESTKFFHPPSLIFDTLLCLSGRSSTLLDRIQPDLLGANRSGSCPAGNVITPRQPYKRPLSAP